MNRSAHNHVQQSPFPGMLKHRRLSVTLHVIVLFLAEKYQQTLDTSLGTCPTVFPSTTTAAGVAMVCLCSRLEVSPCMRPLEPSQVEKLIRNFQKLPQ